MDAGSGLSCFTGQPPLVGVVDRISSCWTGQSLIVGCVAVGGVGKVFRWNHFSGLQPELLVDVFLSSTGCCSTGQVVALFALLELMMGQILILNNTSGLQVSAV